MSALLRGSASCAVCAALLSRPAPAAAWERASYAPGSFTVTLSATWRQLAGYRSDQAAWLSVTLPLERMASPRSGAGAISEETSSEAPADAPSSAPSPEATPDAPQRPSAAPKPTRAPLYRLSSRLARQTVRAALRAAGRASAERWLDGLDSRSRTSSLLPQLRLRGGRTVAESLRLSPTMSDPYRFVQAGGTDVFFDAQLTWDLDRLVFASEELAIERLKQQRDAADAALVRRVLEALFAWQRAVAECASLGLSVDERSDCTLRTLEMTVTLDVLTDGWFTATQVGGQPAG